jgi:predicted Zn-ribbon and HTH transcriptional regulator
MNALQLIDNQSKPADMDVRDQLATAWASLYAAKSEGSEIGMNLAESVIVKLTPIVMRQELAEARGRDQITHQLIMSGIDPSPFAGLRSGFDRTDHALSVLIEDAETSLSTDGEVMVTIDPTRPARWREKNEYIRATGRCPQCRSDTITRDRRRAGTVGGADVWECGSCPFEVPYVDC